MPKKYKKVTTVANANIDIPNNNLLAKGFLFLYPIINSANIYMKVINSTIINRLYKYLLKQSIIKQRKP